MALVSDKLKTCGVKIKAMVGGVPSFGSGVVYVTPNYCNYNYILTAKHIFQEDSQTPFDCNKIFNIEIFYTDKDQFKRLQFIPKKEVKDRLISFSEDFAIVIVDKTEMVKFGQIIVSDELEDEDLDFFSWATFSANLDLLHKFDLKRNDTEMKRFKLSANLNHEHLPGMSGAGVFLNNKSTLHGIICKYPNEDFQNETIDCAQISFPEINNKLKSLKRVELDTQASGHKREIQNEVVDIHQAVINDVTLDLELARKRLTTDIADDWYHDPLRYIDLLTQDYLFKQFELFFNNNKYQATEAEKFYVPKKKLTLRQALISPFIDRIMYIATVGALAEKLDNAMIPNVYSARYNRFSTHQLIINGVEQWKKMKYKLEECAYLKNDDGSYKYGCVIEIDLLNFYDNISKKLLYEKIQRVCDTPNERNAAKLLYAILKNLTDKELGLPQNSDASSLLASFYLNQVDVFMQHNAPEYFRFMDDIRIFCEDKYSARKILQTFEFELRRCYLSVNSQKTEIFTLIDEQEGDLPANERRRSDYDHLFDLELNKVARLRASNNYAYLNEAFHQCISLLENNLEKEDHNSSEESARKLNYALNTIALLAEKRINLYSDTSRFKTLIQKATANLLDMPWITSQVTRVLNLIPTEELKEDLLESLKKLVLDEKYNTYAFQTYQIWLLMAKHKYNSKDLKDYAVRQIEKNDETNRAVIAAMVIYMCSVDEKYRRVILRKFGEGFTHGYFQNRIALISLRSFETEILAENRINDTLKGAHEFTYRFRDRDLVFVQGFNEEGDDLENDIDQLYSV